jgi:lipopolysaccharide/colanic/teichoic acid biosynthesis glycosyltransferase
MNDAKSPATATAEANALGSLFLDLHRTVRASLLDWDGAGTAVPDADIWALIATYLPPARTRRRLVEAARRTLEVGVAVLLLAVTSWLIILLGLLVWAEDRGPALFGHERVTRGGRRFRCWKLRTMRVGTERGLATDHRLWAEYVVDDFKICSSDDVRVTRVGRVLRSTYLDELPQLWNVVRGDMSLVGPRPVIEAELMWYGPLAAELLAVRPGLTGAWQLTDRLGYPQRMWLELAYVRARSVGLDARIVFDTVLTVATGSPRPISRLMPPEKIGYDVLPLSDARPSPNEA